MTNAGVIPDQFDYDVVLLGTDEVIGRQAYVIALDPNGSGVLRQLWVDRATGTVLRGEDRDRARPDHGRVEALHQQDHRQQNEQALQGKLPEGRDARQGGPTRAEALNCNRTDPSGGTA
mgnify:CR=1 FL=1